MLAEIGDCRGRFPTPESLICAAGVAPSTRQSGKHKAVTFRWAADKQLRDAVCDFAGDSRRRAAQLPEALADDIVDQLEHTERVLLRQFFSSEQPRVDGALQRARLAGLLHYYADRSARGGLIAPERLPELHRNIDRIEETAEQPEIEKTGYVISIAGETGFRGRRGGIPIKVLTADDLGKAGFTSIIEPIDPPLPGEQSSLVSRADPGPARRRAVSDSRPGRDASL